MTEITIPAGGSTTEIAKTLGPRAEADLRLAYQAFMAAPFGQLNTSSQTFMGLCRQLGWNPKWDTLEREGYLPWARRMLGIVK